MESRKRTRVVAKKLSALWGEGLPPGEDPYERVAEDALLMDDQKGREDGLIVHGDEVAAEPEQSVATNRQGRAGS
jgi:hypothetical protein